MMIGPGRAGGRLSIGPLASRRLPSTATIAKTSLANLDAARRRDGNARRRLAGARERARRRAVTGIDAAQLAVLAVLLAAAECAGIEQLPLHLGEGRAHRDAVRRAGVASGESRGHRAQRERGGSEGADYLGRHGMTPGLARAPSHPRREGALVAVLPELGAATRRHSEPVHTSNDFVAPASRAAGPLPRRWAMSPRRRQKAG